MCALLGDCPRRIHTRPGFFFFFFGLGKRHPRCERFTHAAFEVNGSMEHRDGSSEFAAPSADCVELDAGEGADGDGLDGGGPGRSLTRQLDERLDRARADIRGMSAGIDDAISSVQQWRLEQEAQVQRQLEQMRQELENAPPPELSSLGIEHKASPCSASRPRTPALRPCSAGGEDENFPTSARRSASRPPSAGGPAAAASSQRYSVPSGSAVLAARAALQSLEQQTQEPDAPLKDSSQSGAAATVAEHTAARQEELASEVAAISDTFSDMEHKLFNYSSGLDD
eukprot:963736-Prymnesium_polylepis.1